MKERIYNYLSKQPQPISFDALMKAFPDCEGDKYLGSENSHLVYWEGMSEDMASTLMELIKDGIIEIKPCSSDIYSDHPDYPIAEQYQFHETFHWLPAVISVDEIKEVH